MTGTRRVIGILTVVSLCPALACAQSGKAGRGKYLTEEVAKCQECHTPRLNGAELDRSRWLKGSSTAPDVTAGGELWKRWGESAMLQYLEKGIGPDGKSPLPPMPAYRLRHEDAEAIVAYLKTRK